MKLFGKWTVVSLIALYFLCFEQGALPTGHASTTADMVGLVSSVKEMDVQKGDKKIIGKINVQGAVNGLSGVRVADVEITDQTIFQEEGNNLSRSAGGLRLLKRGLGIEIGFEKGANLESYPAKVTALAINIVHRGEEVRKKFG